VTASGARPTSGRIARVTDDDSIARDYDRIAESYAREISGESTGKPLDRALLGYVANRAAGRGTVGDLGCGPGHVTRYLADLGADVIGLDLSPAMIRLACAAHPDLRFVVGDLRRCRCPTHRSPPQSCSTR
jgi:SAM-dependent methyltransferase